MTGVIFREWLNKLDRHYRGEKRHILLIAYDPLDACIMDVTAPEAKKFD